MGKKETPFSDKSLLGLLMNGWRDLPLEKRLELASSEDPRAGSSSHTRSPSFSHLQKFSSYYNEKGYCCGGVYHPVTLDLINGDKLFDNIIISSPEDGKSFGEHARHAGGADQTVLYLLNGGFFIREISLFSDDKMCYPRDKFTLYFRRCSSNLDLFKRIEDDVVKTYLKDFSTYYRGGNKIVLEEHGWIRDAFPRVLNECGFELLETK